MKHVAGRREPQVTDCFLNLGETEVGKNTEINPSPRRRSARTKDLRAAGTRSADSTTPMSVGRVKRWNEPSCRKDKTRAEGEISVAATSQLTDGT